MIPENEFLLKVIKNGKFGNTYLGSIKFLDLKRIARLTYRTFKDDDSIGYGIEGRADLYQRKIRKDKINDIAKYIKDSLFDNEKYNDAAISLFPTSMLLSFEIIDRSDEVDIENVKKEAELYKNIVLIKVNNELFLYIPNGIMKIALIVDGQHRFLGVEEFYNRYPELGKILQEKNIDIEFPVTILANYSIYQQAKTFAVVNFKQKQVNRSLYYDIFGSLPEERNEITFSHFITKYLNEDNDSPIKNKIKMSGFGEGTISQAFMVENILRLLKKSENRNDSFIRNNFIDYQRNDKNIGFERELSLFKIYFKAIFKELNADEYNIIYKTTVMGAILMLLGDLDKKNINIENLDIFLRDILKPLKLKASYLFGIDGPYSGGAGLGLQTKLYKELKAIININ